MNPKVGNETQKDTHLFSTLSGLLCKHALDTSMSLVELAKIHQKRPSGYWKQWIHDLIKPGPNLFGPNAKLYT